MKILVEDHTADVILSVEASSLEDIIWGLIKGVSEYYWGFSVPEKCKEETVKISLSGDGPDMTYAIATLLSDLIYAMESKRVVPCKLAAIEYKREHEMVYIDVQGFFYKGDYIPKGEEIKGVSFSVDWKVSIILDL